MPHIANRGHSFVGAGMYYLHDKGARSDERVLFMQSVNLGELTGMKAMKHMAATAQNARELKKAAGVSTRGRMSRAGSVFAFSLSWHPMQQPNMAHMVECAQSAIAKLGLEEHQCMIIGHGDTQHRHVHVVVNLVHPEHGKVADLSYTQLKLSTWASDYERAGEEIFCKEREKNRESREQEQPYDKYQDAPLERDTQKLIAALYEHSRDAQEFVALLAGEGLTLARGDKGRLVLVDSEGNIQNLTRQLPKGVGKKAVLARFADLEIGALPFAADIARFIDQEEEEPESSGGDGEMVSHAAEKPVEAQERVGVGEVQHQQIEAATMRLKAVQERSDGVSLLSEMLESMPELGRGIWDRMGHVGQWPQLQRAAALLRQTQLQCQRVPSVVQQAIMSMGERSRQLVGRVFAPREEQKEIRPQSPQQQSVHDPQHHRIQTYEHWLGMGYGDVGKEHSHERERDHDRGMDL